MQAFLWHVNGLGLEYPVGVDGRQPVLDALAAMPKQAWRKALDVDGNPATVPRSPNSPDGCPRLLSAGHQDADDRPPGMLPPGAQLRITDHEGWRITVFADNTRGTRLADLEVRHRLRARADDCIRRLKDTD